MSWIQDEQQRRAETEKRRQAEAQIAAAKEAKERERGRQKMARAGIKEMNRFSNRVIKVLPDGVSIVEKFYNVKVPDWAVHSIESQSGQAKSYRSSKSGPVLRIDTGDGLELDLLERNWTYVDTFNSNQSSWLETHYEIMVFESGRDFSAGKLLTIISNAHRSTGNRLLPQPTKLSKESMSGGLYDACQRLAAPHGNLETRP